MMPQSVILDPALTVHTPGLSDLSTLDGRTLSFDVGAGVGFDPTARSLLVTAATFTKNTVQHAAPAA